MVTARQGRSVRRSSTIRGAARIWRPAPAVEAMLWHYAFGRARESLDMTVGPAGEELSEPSPEDNLQRMDEPREQSPEQAARERALPAE